MKYVLVIILAIVVWMGLEVVVNNNWFNVMNQQPRTTRHLIFQTTQYPQTTQYLTPQLTITIIIEER
jgi:hypothetical protein